MKSPIGQRVKDPSVMMMLMISIISLNIPAIPNIIMLP